MAPKKEINTIIEQSEEKSLSDLADKVIFTPTKRQRQVKAKFWSRFQPGPFANPDTLSMADVMAITRASSLKEWWSKDGFKEWFMNREEAREKLEYLFMKALDTAEDIMDDPAAQASAKVNAIKVVAELANKFPSKQVEKFADDEINKMDEKQLRVYLEKKGLVIREEKVIEASVTSKDEGSDNGGKED